MSLIYFLNHGSSTFSSKVKGSVGNDYIKAKNTGRLNYEHKIQNWKKCDQA